MTSGHHSERVQELGFNSIRFAFRGDWYVPRARGPASPIVFMPDGRGLLVWWNTRP